MSRQIHDLAHELADDAGVVCSALDHGLLARITDCESVPAAGRLGHSSQVVGHADPTADAALAGRGVDRAEAHRVELRRCLARARGLMRLARRIAESYPETYTAGVVGQADVGRINALGEPGCASCARTRVAAGVARWEPVDSRLAGPTTVAGRLAEPMRLCCWCYERVSAWGRLPSVEELERHHEGRRVRWPTDVPRPKEHTA